MRFLCAKLHGLKKDALATAEFDKDWEGRPMMGPGTKLPPKAPFSGKYWESYWKKYPHLMPEIGNDVQECERNFMEYVRILSSKLEGLHMHDWMLIRDGAVDPRSRRLGWASVYLHKNKVQNFARLGRERESSR